MKHIRLPLVEYVQNELLFESNLEGTLLIACQHILKTNLSMFNYFFQQGLKPGNTYLIGKCYSTDQKVCAALKQTGVYVHPLSDYFDSKLSFDDQFELSLIHFFHSVMKQTSLKEYKKIVILDDGSGLIQLANEHIKDPAIVVGIEQTSSGYERIKNIPLRFPVVNVARSQAKLIYESPYIGELFTKNFFKSLQHLGITIKRALILGKGAIGQAIAKKLVSRGIKISFFDILTEKSDLKNEEFLKNLLEYDAVIGCTGKISFKQDFFEYLKDNAVLVSCSSSDREFEILSIRRDKARYGDCHQNIAHKNFHILNSGFPLTFYQNPLGGEASHMQLTRALIFAAVCVAKNDHYPSGIVDLDEGVQRAITNKFGELQI